MSDLEIQEKVLGKRPPSRHFRDLSEQLYTIVFEFLDDTIDVDGETAGKIANACEKIALQILDE